MSRNPNMQVKAREALQKVIYKEVLVYDAKTNAFIKEFPSVNAVGEWLQETKGASKGVTSSVSMCLHNKRPTCFGYKYEFKDPDNQKRAVFTNSAKHKSNLKAKHDKIIKPVYQYSYDGTLVKKYQNIFKVIEENPSFTYQSLYKAVEGIDTKRRHHYALYSWFYIEKTPEQIEEFNK